MKKTALKESLIFTGFAALILILGAAFRDGGILHFESASFLLNYCDSRTILQKVFDPAHNDWGLYQARELSYLFDMVDARAVDFLIRHGIVWFYSLSSALLLLLTVFLQQYYGRKLFPKLSGIFLTLLSCCFLLAQGVMEVNYFRTAKYLTALALTAAMGSGYQLLFRQADRCSKAVFSAALVIMVLADRQGFFFAAALTGTLGILLLYSCFRKIPHLSSRFLFPVRTGILIVFFGILNNLYLTPAIVRALNGYTPDFGYQNGIPLSFAILEHGVIFVFCNIGHWLFSAENVGVAFWAAVITVTGLFFSIRKYNKFYLIIWSALTVAMILCAGLMGARHPAILQPGVMFGTYFITFLSIFVMLLIFTAAHFSAKERTILIILLLLTLTLRFVNAFSGECFDHDDGYDCGFRTCRYEFKHALTTPGYDVRRHVIPYRMRYVIEYYQKKQK